MIENSAIRVARCIVAAVIGFVPVIATAMAGTYELADGKRYALCREYEVNLKSFTDLTVATTEWPLDPRLKKFGKPHWERLDPLQHIEVIKTIYGFQLNPRTAEEAAEIWPRNESQVTAWLKSSEATLEKAHVSIGKDELIVLPLQASTGCLDGNEQGECG